MSQKDIWMRMIHDYLESENFEFRPMGEDGYFVDGLLKMRTCGFSFGVTAHEYGIRTVCICPVKAPEECQADVAEYLTRVNHTLKTGCFSLDYESGTVEFHNYLPCEEAIPSLEDLEFTIQYPLLAIHKFQSGLADCLTGCGRPRESFERAMQRNVAYQSSFSANLKEV